MRFQQLHNDVECLESRTSGGTDPLPKVSFGHGWIDDRTGLLESLFEVVVSHNRSVPLDQRQELVALLAAEISRIFQQQKAHPLEVDSITATETPHLAEKHFIYSTTMVLHYVEAVKQQFPLR